MPSHKRHEPPPPRRQSLSAPSSPVASLMNARAHYHSPQPAVKTTTSQSRISKRVYESPRLTAPDSVLFPSAIQLQTHNARWQYLSTLAGPHRQDATILKVNPWKVATPLALKVGMPAHAGQCIVELHLPVLCDNDKESITALPAWLDVVVTTFPNIKRLYLQQEGSAKGLSPLSSSLSLATTVSEVLDDGPEEEEESCNDNDATGVAAIFKQNHDKYVVMNVTTTSATKVSAATSQNDEECMDESAVQRLYVLYRLPGLQFLDGKIVTPEERKLARPRNLQELQEHQQAINQNANYPPGQPGNVDEGWVEQAQAKVTAHRATSKKVVGIICLLDNDEEDEENDDPANDNVPFFRNDTRMSRRILSESAGEVDGLPSTVSPERWVSATNKHHRRSATNDYRVIRSPPFLADCGDHWEYASVESSAVACEWTAVCGSLALPYFRKPTIAAEGNISNAAVRERTKSKFLLKFRRQQEKVFFKKSPADFTDDAFDNSEEVLLHRCFDDDPLLHVDGHQTMVSEAQTPTRQVTTISESSGRASVFKKSSIAETPPRRFTAEDRMEPPRLRPDSPTTSSSTQSSCASMNPAERLPQRVSASQSLTSPFPMQFRVRAKAAISPASTLSPLVLSAAADEKRTLKISTDFTVCDRGRFDINAITGPPLPPRKHDFTSTLLMETIEVPIPLSRTQSSPSKLPSFRNRITSPTILTKCELPPPCPGGRRKIISTTTGSLLMPRYTAATKAKKAKRRGTNWREKLSARSMSIIDDDDDDSLVSSSESEYLHVCAVAEQS